MCLNLLGHHISRSARIRPSLIWTDGLWLAEEARIGLFNIVSVRRLCMRANACLGYANMVRGPFSVRLAQHAALGNRNVVVGDGGASSGRPALLSLGIWSKITASHYVNLSESVVIGDYSTFGGIGSQVWTHGFVHMSQGPARAEVRGKIAVGDNVYIGSQSCLSPGIAIASCVSVGAHSSIAQDLMEPGVYVSQPLRFIGKSPEERVSKLPSYPSAGGPPRTLYWRGRRGPERGDRSAAVVPPPAGPASSE